MDKNAIKKYAVWARNELIARVTQKAEQYEITEKKTTPEEADSIGGRLLSEAEKKQRAALIEKIKTDGFEQVMEEVAYTWFNRFTALRFMEVNNYLPSHTRVFTNEAGEFKPQILTDAIQLDLEGLNMDKVFELKDANKTEELYKYLLITQCNALSSVLPRMFQKIAHYTELLLPDYLLREGSVIEQMIAIIPEEDWMDQVQIIGWLYQYYNSEPKDAVFAALKKNVKISKENIPAATQLFTPDWIVRYMVENSLGRLWLEGHPNDVLKSGWTYFLDEAEQEVDIQKHLDEIRKEYATLKPEEIRCIDPSMGSGHILCYMFDVLVKIYEDYGYTAREAVENIVEKNLWGLDIDERATQLSYFAIMMKARQYDRRFFTKGIQPHVYVIEESNGITSAPMHDMGVGFSQEEYGKAVKQAMRLVEEMHDAKEYGSIINVTECDWDLLRRFAIPRGVSEGQLRLDIHGEIEASDRLQKLINIGETLSQKYHVVITNPPYMSIYGMSSKLADYVKAHYFDTKGDMFSVFIERSFSLLKKNGYSSLITMESWMFLSSFEKFRKSIVDQYMISSMLHMPYLGKGSTSMGINFGTDIAIIQKKCLPEYVGKYERISYYETNEEGIPLSFPMKNEYYKEVSQKKFHNIPGCPISYWVSDAMYEAFQNKSVEYYSISDGQNVTSNNDRFLRLFWEVDNNRIGKGTKWRPYAKGGDYRRWYGNIRHIIDWSEEAITFYHKESSARVIPDYLWYREGITWSLITSAVNSFRYLPPEATFDKAGSSIFIKDEHLKYYLAILNSCISNKILKIMNSTISLQVKDVRAVPVVFTNVEKIESIVTDNIKLSKEEWDSHETSMDFEELPLLKYNNLSLYDAVARVINDRHTAHKQLAENELEINKLLLEAYKMTEEMSPEVEDKYVSLPVPTEKEIIVELISYAVGCMFGRYSLDSRGLVYAGGEWNASQYKMFVPDKDAIIPICDDEYFEDDIVNRFVKFIEVVFGTEHLEDNLRFIADNLGKKGSTREVIRSYFVNGFFADHCSMYSVSGSGKRPIYWLFDSGKKNGFKCLVYMHRYRPDTIARIRTDYVHEQQSRYRTAITDLENRINGASTSERVKLNKQLSILQDQAAEVRVYEEKIHHLADQMISINLDDGVKHNYEIFKDVLAKI